jgi:hypothetical protein
MNSDCRAEVVPWARSEGGAISTTYAAARRGVIHTVDPRPTIPVTHDARGGLTPSHAGAAADAREAAIPPSLTTNRRRPRGYGEGCRAI